MSKRLVIVGSGNSGLICARAAKDRYPELEVILVGPESKEQDGLFYFNSPIPGIAEREVKVSYDYVGPNISLSELKSIYQLKTRGCTSEDVSKIVSSFDKVGTSELGYRLNSGLDLKKDIIYHNTTCQWISLTNNFIVINDDLVISYDYLFVTTPYPVTARLLVEFGEMKVKDCVCSPIYVSSNQKEEKDFTRIIVTYNCYPDQPVYRSSQYISDIRGVCVNSSVESTSPLSENYRKVSLGKIVNLGTRPSCFSRTARRTFDLLDLEKIYPIKFLGRFARWDYHYLVNDSYNDAMKFLENNLNS